MKLSRRITMVAAGAVMMASNMFSWMFVFTHLDMVAWKAAFIPLVNVLSLALLINEIFLEVKEHAHGNSKAATDGERKT